MAQVKEIMCSDVVWVEPGATVREVAQEMSDNDCGCIFVGEGEKLTGVITDRDIALRCVAEGKDPSVCMASDIMTPSVYYCQQSDSHEDVAQNMAEAKVRRLLVLDENKRMVGVISLGDLAREADEQASGQALGQICSEDISEAA